MNPRDLIKDDFRESLFPYIPIISLPFGMGYIIQRWFLSIFGNQIEFTSLRPSVSTIRMPLIHYSSSMSTPTLSMRFCVLIDTLSSSRFIPSMVQNNGVSISCVNFNWIPCNSLPTARLLKATSHSLTFRSIIFSIEYTGGLKFSLFGNSKFGCSF